MIEDNVTYCEAAYRFIISPATMIVMGIHLTSAIVSLILIAIVFTKFVTKRLFEFSFRILILVMLTYIAIYNLNVLAVTLFHLYHIFTHVAPCDILFYKKDCFWLLYPIFSAFCGLCYTQFAVGLERLFTSLGYGDRLKQSGCLYRLVIGTTALLLLIAGPFTYWFFVFNNPFEQRLHCMGIIYKLDPRPVSSGNTLYYSMLGVEGVATLLFLNAWRICKRNQAVSQYSVSRKLKSKTNLLTIRLFIPQAISHSLLISLFVGSAFLLHTLRPLMDPNSYAITSFSLYSLPYFSLVQLVLLLLVMKREEARQKQHFRVNFAATLDTSKHWNIYQNNLMKAWE